MIWASAVAGLPHPVVYSGGMRIEDTIGPDDLARVTARQKGQQDRWRRAPEEGYCVSFAGLEFVVLPDVFPPRSDTDLLRRHLRVAEGSVVLDVGTGSGALAVLACKAGAARCVALDISPAAVRNAEINAGKHGLSGRIDVRLSDGLAALQSAEVFDLVIANLPGRAAEARDLVESAQWDAGFRTHRRFLEGIGAHLAPAAEIVMTKANYPEINELLDLAERAGFQARVLATQGPEGDDPRTYYALALARTDATG